MRYSVKYLQNDETLVILNINKLKSQTLFRRYLIQDLHHHHHHHHHQKRKAIK